MAAQLANDIVTDIYIPSKKDWIKVWRQDASDSEASPNFDW
jgi:hypothetical protein